MSRGSLIYCTFIVRYCHSTFAGKSYTEKSCLFHNHASLENLQTKNPKDRSKANTL